MPSVEVELDSFERLTPRQKEVVSLLLKGFSYRQISENLGISLYTVRAHLHSAYERLEVKSRGQAAAKIFSHMANGR